LSERENHFREHINVARDSAIFVAVLLYFLGFVYLYYYFDRFGVSIVAIQLAPQNIYIFAYSVLSHDLIVTIEFSLILLVLTIGYNYAIVWLRDQEQHDIGDRSLLLLPGSADRNDVAIPAWVKRARSLGNRSIRGLPLTAVIVVIFIGFPAIFSWAQRVAYEDSTSQLQAAHKGTLSFLRLIEVQDGPLVPSTPDFHTILRKINDAGGNGRALQVGESADRIFILVSTTIHTKDNTVHWQEDHVFAINKSLVAVEGNV
jgi:hypothetical protein